MSVWQIKILKRDYRWEDQFFIEFGLPIFLNILLNNPRNQPNRHIPFRIDPRDHETHIIFLTGHPVVVAAVGHGIDADVEADEYGALVDVRDRPGILALDLALA